VKRLLKTSSSLPSHSSYLERIFKETWRLETILQRVEEYVLISKLTFQKEKIQEVVEAALQTFSVEATEKGVSFDLDTGALGRNGNLFVDKDLVIKALCHIFRNSLESMTRISQPKKRRSMKITLFEREESIGISISDRGGGIAKKDLDRIFDPFFSTRPDRMGLGLTFTKRVMEEHGGKIQVESQLKKGTTVTLVFPKERRRKVRQELISPEVPSV